MVNGDFTDAGDEITNSIPIDGSVGMTGQLLADEGDTLSPGLSFGVDTNTGFRLVDPDNMAWVSGAQDRITLDSDGKFTFTGGINASGSLGVSDPILSPANLFAFGESCLLMRREENDASEHEILSYESGNGSGAKGSLRVVGNASNSVSLMRFYVNNVKAFEWSSTLFSIAADVNISSDGARIDSDGHIDLKETNASSAPPTDILRFYCRDTSGKTFLYYKGADGIEIPISSVVTRDIFTSSSTWTKPSAGSIALIETWGGGGGSEISGGPGGGGSFSRRIIPISSLSANVSVTVGAGGATGSAGGGSSFGSYVSSYGGGRGSGSGAGGGGGGLSFGGSNAVGTAGGNGGAPFGLISSSIWGLGGTGAGGSSSPFGGGGGGSNQTGAGATSLNGGGGGANGGGGISIFGGGGGGGISGAGGISLFGGNGGDNGVSGSAPGGGGGRGDTTGARGEVRITVW